MRKIKVCISGIHYPLSMMSYFIRAFERRTDVELVTAGPFTGDLIPWAGGIRIPQKYVKQPTVPLPMNYINQVGLDPSFVQLQLPWEPDLWIQCDAGWWIKKPKATVVAHIATDPHVLNYDRQRKECDIFFNMQLTYSKERDRYLPYAFDPTVHYPMNVHKEFDGCLIGLHYENRNQLVHRLHLKGYNIYYGLGEVYNEFAYRYNQSHVALNWSSLLDLNARTFEAFGMGLALLTNRVPDLPTFFVEGDHYLGFDTLEEAEKQFDKFMADEDMRIEMADAAMRKANAAHTYDHRVEQILDSCKFI